MTTTEPTTTYRSQAARDAAASGYGDQGYWEYLDRSAQETYEYFIAHGDPVRAANEFTQTLSDALRGNDGE